MGTFRRHNVFILFLLIMPYKVSCSKIIQGDILVSTGTNSKSDPSMASGVQLADPSKFWPQGKVYYRFEPSFQNTRNKKQIRDMMDYITTKLNDCITFHEVSNSYSDHVLITNRGCEKQPGNRCYATVGRKGGMQCLNLDQKCMSNGTIVHELLHTMGFEHEHLRPDRDQFLTVMTENIPVGKKDEFKKRVRGSSRYFEASKLQNVQTHNSPFDLGSVLLYPPAQSKQFSKDGKTPILKYKVPIIPSWPFYEEPLTAIDTVEIALAYSCALDQQQMIQYIHSNRISSAQQLSGLYRKVKTLEIFQSALIPDIVTVSSDKGPASQAQNTRMGVFTRSGYFNGHPMWSLHDNTQKIFYSTGGYWLIGSDPESNEGGIKSVKTGLAVLPVTGWEYTDYDGDTWKEDTELTVMAGQPVYPQSIQVSSTGPAADEHPFCLGQYHKIEGQQQNGRPLWKHSERDARILYFSDSNSWMIGSDPKTTSGFISSVKKGLVNIPETGWKYWDEGSFHQDDQLKSV